MLARLRRNLTFANVCSFIALFVALSTGAAYAANTVGSSDIIDGEVKSADIGDAAVTSAKIADGAVLTAKIGAGAVGTQQLAANAVDASRISADSIDSSKVAPDSLGAGDIKGADVDGLIDLKKGAVAKGRCLDLDLAAAGASPGETVMISSQGPLPAGTVLYGVRVPSVDVATIKVCNFNKQKKMPAVTDLPVRIITFG